MAKMATPEELIRQAEETGGAAYRTQKHAWIPQQDNQRPYWSGFSLARTQYGQVGDNIDVGITERPVNQDPQGTPRARPSKQTGGEGGPKSNRKNVLARTPHSETTGEDPAPLFTHGQIKSRS